MTAKTRSSLSSFFLLEVAPIIMFFTTFYMTDDFILAALILGIASTFSIALSLSIHKRLPYFTLVVAGTTIIAAAFTYSAQNPQILITRDTLYYSFFGLFLLFTAKNKVLILKKMFETVFGITDTGWQILQYRWAVLLIILGVANIFIGLYLPLSYWVGYKSSLMIVFLIFGTYQFTLSKKHRLKDTNAWGLRQ